MIKGIFKIGFPLFCLCLSVVSTADEDAATQAKADIDLYRRTPVGQVGCDADGMAIWDTTSNTSPLGTTTTMKVQVPEQLQNGTKAIYNYFGPYWVPSDGITKWIKFPDERPDIGVLISKEKFTAGRVTAHFFANLQFKNGIRDYGAARAWVTLNGKTKNFAGLSVTGRWANVVGTKSVPTDLANFQRGDSLVLSRTLTAAGTGFDNETYCITHNPEKSNSTYKQVCVQFHVDLSKFRPGFAPEEAPVGQVRALVLNSRSNDTSKNGCQNLKKRNNGRGLTDAEIETMSTYFPKNTNITDDTVSHLRQPVNGHSSTVNQLQFIQGTPFIAPARSAK